MWNNYYMTWTAASNIDDLVSVSVITLEVFRNGEVTLFCWSTGSEQWAAPEPELVCSAQAAGPPVTEWVLESQAEKWRVTVKVNKIKAGNLRASVLHKRCRRQQREGWSHRRGWDEGLGLRVGVFLCICCRDLHLLCERCIVTGWRGSFAVDLCWLHTLPGRSQCVNGQLRHALTSVNLSIICLSMFDIPHVTLVVPSTSPNWNNYNDNYALQKKIGQNTVHSVKQLILTQLYPWGRELL